MAFYGDKITSLLVGILVKQFFDEAHQSKLVEKTHGCSATNYPSTLLKPAFYRRRT